MDLQLRGKEVLRIQNFKAASQEDVAAVHAMGYVKGLERVSSLLDDRMVIRLLSVGGCPVDELLRLLPIRDASFARSSCV